MKRYRINGFFFFLKKELEEEGVESNVKKSLVESTKKELSVNYFKLFTTMYFKICKIFSMN